AEVIFTAPFALRGSGETLYLIDAADRGGQVLDAIEFGLMVSDLSLARVPDGSGSWQLAQPSPRAPHHPLQYASPAAIRINEWLASNPDGGDWLELFNPGANPIEL